jgi:hypothetical protein
MAFGRWIPLACIALLFSGPLCATSTAPLPDIVQQQQKIRDELASGTLKLNPRQTRIVGEQQAIVFEVTEGKTSLSDLNADEQVRLRNALEAINAQVSPRLTANDEREVCWREKRTGSKLVTTVCGTEKERREAREGARDYLSKPSICQPPGCGASP